MLLTKICKICICDIARYIWKLLQITHDSISQVKGSKMNMLMRNYELLKMKLDESIKKMYTRFTDIVTGLKGLGKKLFSEELVNKILRSLPKSREIKVVTTEKAKNLSKLSSEELISS